MKNINKAIMMTGLSLSLLLAGGCDDFLTTDMPSYVDPTTAYSTETEADLAMAGIYSFISESGTYATQLSISWDAGCDEGMYNSRYNDGWIIALYCYTASESQLETTWTSLYETINHANIFIENLKVDNFSETKAAMYMGEARFLRALAYMNLTFWWDEVPLRTRSTQDQNDNNWPASPVEDVYAFIAEDLLFAAENLYHASDDNYENGRANSMAARGLLARLYLKQAGAPLKDTDAYKLAEEQLDIIIEDGWHQLIQTSGTYDIELNNGYRDVFEALVGDVYLPRENMFEISFRYDATNTNLAGSIGALNGLYYTGSGTTDGPYTYAMHSVSVLLDNLYREGDEYYVDDDGVQDTDILINDTGDPRRFWNAPGMQYSNSTGYVTAVTKFSRYYCSGKYRRWTPVDTKYNAINNSTSESDAITLLENVSLFNKNSTSVNFPVLRYADVLLMKAEVEYRLNGETQTAYDYLNEVRTRSHLPELTVGTYSGDNTNFFDEIVEERMKELCFEGVRTYDLRRWDILEERLTMFAQAILTDPDYKATDDQTASQLRQYNYFIANPTKWGGSLAYPLVEVTMNTELNQKSGW